jgi:fructokinase
VTAPLGGIEAGGTKFVCVVGTPPGGIVREARFPTRDPAATIADAIAFFREAAADGHGIAALGVAAFGPLELRPGHPRRGAITTTPKPGWSGTDLAGPLGDALGVPVGVDTDVNGAALAEGRWGAAQGLGSFVYVTVGTGVGGGAVVGGAPVHGLPHPEMGHVGVTRLAGDDFPGVCPFHGDCLEGMASGPAIAARWRRPAQDLAGDDLARAVEIEAHYLAAGLRNVVYALAPERIVVGGGVAAMPGLLPAVGARLADALAGYPGLPEHTSGGFVVPPGLGAGAGAAGALALAEAALA